MNKKIIGVDIGIEDDRTAVEVKWNNNDNYNKSCIGNSIINEHGNKIGTIINCDVDYVTGIIWDQELISMLLPKESISVTIIKD